MFDAAYYASLGLGAIYERIIKDERLSAEDGLALFVCPDQAAVAALACHKRFKLHGKTASYVVNRQVNYTNICVNGCLFCAFRRDDARQQGAFTLSKEDIMARISAAAQQGIDEIHMVGGCHPDLRLAWFEDLLATISSRFPDLPIKAFTPVEIEHFSRQDNISTLDVLKRLRNAGLIMMPGGGAEIFDPVLRSQICPQKADAAAWLRISGEAHSLGISTNCTMLFGHRETLEQRIDHLCRLREQQDKSGGFTCFIPLPFLKLNNRLRLPEHRQGPGDGLDYLRTIAVSRLMLDNIPHIKAYWVMLGVKLAQAALWYGADDLDGTIVEEHIGHMAGSTASQALTIDELETMIRQSGFEPARRNAVFQMLEEKAACC